MRGPSWQSRVVVGYLRAQRRRRRLESAALLHASLPGPGERSPDDARPPAWLRRGRRIGRGTRHGFPCWSIAPRGPATERSTAPHLLYLHGGAYVGEIFWPQWRMIAALADRAGARAIVPIYPLAPEATCDDAFALVLAVYRDLLDHVGPERIAVVGDSAGGGLALALAQLARDAGLPQPARLVLLAPWLDVALGNPEIPAIERDDPMLAVPGLLEAGRLWAGERPLDDPLVSPLHAELGGLAPIVQHVGTRDLALPDMRRLRDRARAAGHPLEHVEHPGMFHVFMAAPIPEARRALDALATTLSSPTTTPQEVPPR